MASWMGEKQVVQPGSYLGRCTSVPSETAMVSPGWVLTHCLPLCWGRRDQGLLASMKTDCLWRGSVPGSQGAGLRVRRHQRVGKPPWFMSGRDDPWDGCREEPCHSVGGVRQGQGASSGHSAEGSTLPLILLPGHRGPATGIVLGPTFEMPCSGPKNATSRAGRG